MILRNNIQAQVYLDFANMAKLPEYIICSRSGNAYFYKNGLLTLANSNTVRWEKDKGILIEPTRENKVLFCRDLSQSDWTGYANCSLSEVGIDGVASSASLIDVSTETDIYQSFTLSTDKYAVSAHIKLHPDNTDPVYISNNGEDFQLIDPVTDKFNRYVVVSEMENPGIFIRTSGKLIVDYCQVEVGSYASSPIYTTTSASTRNADLITIDWAVFNVNRKHYVSTLGSWLVDAELIQPGVKQTLMYASSYTPDSEYVSISVEKTDSRIKFYAGYGSEFEYQLADNDLPEFYTVGKKLAIASTYTEDIQYAYINGAIPALPETPQSETVDYSSIEKIWLGCAGSADADHMGGYIRKFAYYNYNLQPDDALILTQNTA